MTKARSLRWTLTTMNPAADTALSSMVTGDGGLSVATTPTSTDSSERMTKQVCSLSILLEAVEYYVQFQNSCLLPPASEG